MFLAAFFIFFLARTIAYPVSAPDNPIPPISSIARAVAATSECIKDPTKVRSLGELVYNCLGTIAVCTYIAIHPNMPDRNAAFVSKTWQKISTTIYALVAPELVIMWAMKQRIVASRIQTQFRPLGWTKAHGFFVQMGGLMFDDGESYRVVTIDEDGLIQVGEKSRSQGWDILLPTIDEEELQDKGKGDFLSKAVVVIQTSWFVLQCIARHTQGLVITELELITLAFATLNIITYFLWWNKPLNAGHPIYFTKNGERSSGRRGRFQTASWTAEVYYGMWAGWGSGSRDDESEESISHRIRRDLRRRSFVMTIWKRFMKGPFVAMVSPFVRMMHQDGALGRTSVDPYYAGPLTAEDHSGMVYVSASIGVLFGALHLIGWNFEFPTKLEQFLWRVTSIVVTIEPALIAFLFVLSPFVEDGNDHGWLVEFVLKALLLITGVASIYIGPIVYTLARLTLLTQALFALRDLPPSAYQNVQWTAYIPHI